MTRAPANARPSTAPPSPPSASWYRATTDGIVVRIKVAPRAKHDGIVGLEADRLKVRVRAAPVDNAANKAVIGLIAKAVGLPKSAVTIIRGAHSQHKDLLLTGRPEAAVARLIKP